MSKVTLMGHIDRCTMARHTVSLMVFSGVLALLLWPVASKDDHDDMMLLIECIWQHNCSGALVKEDLGPVRLSLARVSGCHYNHSEPPLICALEDTDIPVL